MANLLAWCAANSPLFALLAAWCILALWLDLCGRYASTLLRETHNPDPLSSDSLLTMAVTSPAASDSDSDPHGIIAASQYVRSHFSPQQFMPTMTVPLLVVVTPRACASDDDGKKKMMMNSEDCIATKEQMGQNLDDIFLERLNTTVWWTEFEVCVAANNLSSAIIASPIGLGNAKLYQHFPKLISSDNTSVNAYIWLGSAPSSSSGSSSSGGGGSSSVTDGATTSPSSGGANSGGRDTTAAATEFDLHTQLRTVVRACFSYIKPGQPKYIQSVDTFHFHEALAETRSSLVLRWPTCILISTVVIIFFVSMPAARTLVRAETKTVFVSLLRTRGKEVSDQQYGGGGGSSVPSDIQSHNLSGNIAPHQQQQQQTQAANTTSIDGSPSPHHEEDPLPAVEWSDALIVDVACGRIAPKRAIHSLARQYSRSMSGFDSSAPADQHHNHHHHHQQQQQQQQPYQQQLGASHVSFLPSFARQFVVHLGTFLWFLTAGGALPFCIIIAGVRLAFEIRGTAADDRRELSSSFFFPALLLTA